MTVWFVTGTDTDVGKTVVTAAMVVAARAAGRSPYVIKPAQTGVTDDEPGDLATVRRLAGGVPGHEGARLRDPLAPDTAARREGVTLPSLQDQLAGVADAAAWYDTVIVEGAGGLLVRIGETWDLGDLALAAAHTGIDARFIVVARPGLGTLNHTALTVQALSARGLTIQGLVIGSTPTQPDLAARENLHDLPIMTGVPVIGQIPEGVGHLAAVEFGAQAAGWFGPDLLG